METEALVPVIVPFGIEPYQARLNITFGGQNGDLPDPITYDTADTTIRAMVEEAIRNGGIPGIAATANVDLTDYKVDRFEPTEARPHRLISVRPKTAFGN